MHKSESAGWYQSAGKSCPLAGLRELQAEMRSGLEKQYGQRYVNSECSMEGNLLAGLSAACRKQERMTGMKAEALNAILRSVELNTWTASRGMTYYTGLQDFGGQPHSPAMLPGSPSLPLPWRLTNLMALYPIHVGW